MAGTKQGGIKLRETMIKKHGSYEAWQEWVKEIAAKGGRNGKTGGFAHNPELARIAGAKGGRISKRGKAKQSMS